MQIFICTFLIKLQYVKKVKQSSDKKLPLVTFQAFLKGPKNHIIASGSNKPTLMNDTAWFNEKFEIKSDLLFNPETHAYNQSTLTLQIKCKSKLATTTHIKSFSLAEVAEKKVISERDYYMTGGLIANIELACSEMENKGVKPLRMNGNSPEQVKKTEEQVKTFLLLETVSFTQEKSNHDTPQFHQQQSKQVEDQLQQQPLVLQKDLGPQLLALRQQFHNEQNEHKVTKEKLKSVKQLLENEYNTNRELNLTISDLNKKIQEERAKYQSLENHLSETENLCNALSATLSHKETDIIQAQASFDELRRKLLVSTKKNEEAEGLERTKAQLEWQVSTLKKQIDSLKANLSKYFLSDNQTKNQLEKIKNENIRLKKLKDKLDEEMMKLILKDKENSLTIYRQIQQINSIKRQTQKWRAQFAIESQHKDQQINHLQQHYNQIYSRYSQIQKKQQIASKSVKKEVCENMKKDYEKKLEQKEQKEDKLRQQLEIIEEEILNLQELLEEKEDNEEMLLQHIKKLQHEVDTYAISDKWWSAILEKHQAPESADKNDQISKLQSRNKKLIDLLQKNSYTILQGEKYKLELTSLKKDHEQLIHKLETLAEAQSQLKEKISNLYRENKKLQEKNFNLAREKEALNKKNLWLEEEIVQAKNLEKEARQDYEIVSFQLSKIANKRHNEDRQEYSMKHLSVIRENSEELIASSHKLVRDISIQQKPKSENEGLEKNVYLQLLKLVQERGSQSQLICSELQRIIAPRLLSNGQGLTKDLRRLSIQTSKIKVILVRSGKREFIRQWQQVVASLMGQMQQFIINN